MSKNMITYFILILFCPLIGKLLKAIIDYYNSYKNSKKEITLLDALFRITQREFEIWCSEYLTHTGFENIALLPINTKQKNIIGSKSNNKYYIKCTHHTINDPIDMNEVETLLGSMICDNITHGLLISTGKISDSVKEFILNLKSPYKINIISSLELDYLYSDYISKFN